MHTLQCDYKLIQCIHIKIKLSGGNMKNFVFLASLLLIIFTNSSQAQDHSHHVKHNMILFGTHDNLYVSHIVYKKPHNFQVILKIRLTSELSHLIEKEMEDNPSDQFILLLDHMDIGKIYEKPIISGQVFRRKSDGSKKIILNNLEISPLQYSVVFFNELPLSLEN